MANETRPNYDEHEAINTIKARPASYDDATATTGDSLAAVVLA